MSDTTAQLTFDFSVGDDTFIAKLPTIRERLLFRTTAERIYQVWEAYIQTRDRFRGSVEGNPVQPGTDA